jgi:hypothetical protein
MDGPDDFAVPKGAPMNNWTICGGIDKLAYHL